MPEQLMIAYRNQRQTDIIQHDPIHETYEEYNAPLNMETNRAAEFDDNLNILRNENPIHNTFNEIFKAFQHEKLAEAVTLFSNSSDAAKNYLIRHGGTDILYALSNSNNSILDIVLNSLRMQNLYQYIYNLMIVARSHENYNFITEIHNRLSEDPHAIAVIENMVAPIPPAILWRDGH